MPLTAAAATGASTSVLASTSPNFALVIALATVLGLVVMLWLGAPRLEADCVPRERQFGGTPSDDSAERQVHSALAASVDSPLVARLTGLRRKGYGSFESADERRC